VPISCFALPESFSAVPRASVPVFMFCALELIFGGTEGAESHFHILRARTHFRRYQGHQIPFSCFAIPGTFSVVRRASGLVFILCASGLVFRGTEGVGSRFHVLRPQTHFWRYQGCRVPSSSFALRDIFSAVPKASGPVFMFCTPGLIFRGPEGDGSRFHVLRAGTSFWRYGGRHVPFSCLRSLTCFWRYGGCRVPYYCFARLDTFPAEMRVPSADFMFCAPVVVFDGTEGVSSRFHVLRARTRFRRYRGRQVPFSCFALPDSFLEVPRASDPVFMFCASEHIFGGAECVGSCFHVLRAQTHF
jgi:hypothetical protein